MPNASAPKVETGEMTVLDMRLLLAAVFRTTAAKFKGVRVNASDRMEAIRLDTLLERRGEAARSDETLSQFLERFRK